MTEQELRDKQKIVLLLTQMQAKLDAAEQKAHQPIAVIGMGCRMPGQVDSADSFWAMLEAGTDAVIPVPPGRWDADTWYDPDPDAPGKMNTRRGGFLHDVDKFDAEFFGISPREAISMDPQQRLVLEVAWRALEHANVRPQSLAGSKTGVFLGICTSDYARMGDGSGSMGALDTYSGTGGANGVAAGRLSYTLGLQGPSMVIDTACSSSLVATHLAVQSLRSGECRLALAGGVNLVLLPDGTVTLSRLHMMAPDGRCKAFDAAADGFVRGEGCGIVVLKRLADAQADGDTVLAVIRGSAVNQDGRSAGLTAPNGLAQQAVVREALANARVNPADIAYVEAHGTGTALGDPVEINALAAVLGQGRTRPLLVGSVKTNIGHLEAAAGVAGLIKAIETVRRGRVAPSLHFHQINPHIQTGNCVVSVPTATAELAADLPRLVGVSAFGFSGTNAHVVLEAAPPQKLSSAQQAPRAEVLPLSAKTAAALADLKNGFLCSPALDQFADACFTAATGRNAFAHRLAIVADSGTAAIEQLRLATGRVAAAPRIAFLFSGQGAQASGMGQFQYQTEPVFRAVIDRCAAVLDPLLGRSLTGLMFQGGVELNRTEYAQPALLAFELAMVELLRSWGIEPEALLGHSLGEYVAATVAGSLPFDEALRLVALRGQLMQALPEGGAMAAVLAGHEALGQLLANNPSLAMAADNGPAMVTIAGPVQAIEAACAALQAQGIESRRLPVSHAFHSALMEPALDKIEAAAAQVNWQVPRIPVISNLDGLPMACPDAAYWRRHTREPVAFAAGVRELAARGCNIFIEVGPNPVLLGMARSCASAMPASAGITSSAIEWVAISRLGQNASGMQALAKLFEAGVDVRWDSVHAGRGRRHVALPGHPMRRVSYWRIAALPAAQAEHPLLNTRVDLADGRTVFRSSLPDPALALLAEHKVGGRAIAPAALLLEACASAALRCGHPAALSAISFLAALPLDAARELTIELDTSQVSLQSRKPDGGAWTVHLQAALGGSAAAALPVGAAEVPHAVDPVALHSWMQAGGIEYGPVFRRIQLASRGTDVALAKLAPITSAPYRLHPALLDAAFQALAVASFETGDGAMRIPVGLDYFEASDAPDVDAAWAHVRLAGSGASLSADVWLCDGEDRTLARAQGLQLAGAAASTGAKSSWQEWLLQRQWRLLALPPACDELAQHAASGFATETVRAALGALAGLGLGMDRLAAVYAAQALASVPPETVAERHQALYRRLPLLALAADAALPDPDVLLAELHHLFPDSAREIGLLQRCGSQLAAVLQGRQDPLQLLFPAENQDNVYRDSPVSRALNRGVEDAVMAALPAHGLLRILEVGAGTGGTTDGLLLRLPVERIEEYAFTDISPSLLAAAGRRHASQAWLRPRRLDIDLDPLGQGFAAGHYDIIVAANVIHAGADLKRSLQGLARLLAPNGVLVMLEGAGPQGWIDLAFGLTDGWWRFTDHERRPDYPVPSRVGWLDVLHESGLNASAVEARVDDVLDRQVILVARHHVAEKWLVAGGDDALSLALAKSLGTLHIAADAVLPPGQWHGCLFTGALQMAAEPAGLNLLMADQQRTLDAQRRLALACSERGLQLVVLTSGAHAASANQATAWGLGRAIAAELPDVGLRLIDVDPGLPIAQATSEICSELQCRDGEDQLALTPAGRQVARLARLQPLESGLPMPAVLDPSAAYLITGGFGGLGLHSAAWLVRRGARCLVLMGRSSPSLEAGRQIAQFEADGVVVHQFMGDVAVEGDVCAALASPECRVAGIVHAAGALDDGVLAQLDWPRMERVLRAKVAGAWLLDSLAGPLDFFLLYSSAVSLVGSRGQANHVAANAYLDALAAKRRIAGQAAVSIAWGAWSDIGSATGMQLHRRLQLSGMDTIAPVQGTQVLDWALDSAPAAFGVLPIRWPAFAQALAAQVPPVLRELVPALPRPAATLKALTPAVETASHKKQSANAATAAAKPLRMLDLLLTEAAAVLAAEGPGAIDPARSLFELGLDSLMAVELRNRVQLKLGRSLPSTLLFDHPTPSGLAAFLGDEAETDSVTESPRAASNEAIAIIGMDCRFPGGASNPERFWQLLCEAYDAIGGYPADRHGEAATPGRQGAFLADVDKFDAAFFRIAPREAASMDPQQRLLLETAWHALERAGQAPDRQAGSSTGVFIGVCNYDYPQLVAAAGQVDAWTATGGAPSIVAGRLAYVLGLEGPAMVVDTACSSSLVSVHLACQSLLAGDCDMALAGGVNLILTTSSTEALSTLHMLAPDARCKTFDSRADGFVRGEGCGVVVLKRLSDAQANGDNVLAVIAGSYVNQDGRSPSLTAPSGRAQESVIRHAQARAGVVPAEVAYVETHGTGTQLGDPIEIHALRAVFGTARPASEPLVVGAVKSNIGHLEAAAGIAGLIKATLAVAHARIPPNLHFRQINPHINLDGLAINFPSAVADWPLQGLRVAGVSAFGFSGTNAHIVIRQAEPEVARPAPAATGPQLLLVSGTTPEAAHRFARAVAERLLAADAPSLADLAYTLIAGRAQLEWRIAIVASTAAEAASRLVAAQAQATPAQPVRVGFVLRGQKLPAIAALHALYDTQPVFSAAIKEVDQSLAALPGSQAGRSISAALFDPAHTETSAVLHFAFAYASCRLLAAWGLLANAFVVEGCGTQVAACMEQSISLAEALTGVLQASPSAVTARHGSTAVVPVNDAAAVAALDCDVLLAIDADIKDMATGNALVPSMCDGTGLADMLAALHLAGCRLAPDALRAAGAQLRADVPVYPFESGRHWVGPALVRLPVATAPVGKGPAGVHPLLGAAQRSPGPVRRYQSLLSTGLLPWLAQHRVAGAATLPAAAMMEIMLATAEPGKALAIEQIEFNSLLDLSEPTLLQTEVADSHISLHATLASSDDWRAIAQCTLVKAVWPAAQLESLASLRERLTQPLGVDAFYGGFEQASALDYGPAFRTVNMVYTGQAPGQCLARLVLPEGLDTTAMRLHPALLDGAFQSVGAAVASLPGASETGGAYLPTGIERFSCAGASAPHEVWAWTCLQQRADGAFFANIELFSPQGEPLARVEKLLLQPMRSHSGRRAFLHDMQWQAADAGRSLPSRWHLVAGDAGSNVISADLARRLVMAGSTVVSAAEAQAVVFFADVQATDVMQPSIQALQLAQKLVQLPEAPQLW
ncbi:MAG: beta-ketoacyl synthase N-terminal-like domain-containing protein, partial [Pseudomonadota bacterium]